MLRLIFSSALILALISCPYRCSVGLHLFKLLDRGTTNQSVGQICASCCSKPDSQRSAPVDESHSDSGCSCLCGGAILPNHSSLQGTTQPANAYDLPSVRNLLLGEYNLVATPQCDKPLETDGRALQTRLMSFLC